MTDANNDRDDDIKERAFKIFREELRNHMERILTAVAKPFEYTEISSLRNCFHTIRGGAGFFGLSELAGVSGELEKLVMSDEASLISNMNQFNGKVARLTELSEEILG